MIELSEIERVIRNSPSSAIANLSRAARRDLTGPALRTFFHIAEAWVLNSEEEMRLLGISSRSVLNRWKRGEAGALQPETLERISYVFGIFKAINTLLPKEAAADSWIRRPNTAPLFGGRPAIDLMTSGHVRDLRAVRQYLDAEIGDDEAMPTGRARS